VGFLLLGF